METWHPSFIFLHFFFYLWISCLANLLSLFNISKWASWLDATCLDSWYCGSIKRYCLNCSSFHTFCFADMTGHSMDLALLQCFKLQFEIVSAESSSFFFKSCKNWMADFAFKLCFIAMHILYFLFQCCLTHLSNIFRNFGIEIHHLDFERNFFPLSYLFVYLKNALFTCFTNLDLISGIGTKWGCFHRNCSLELVSAFIVFCNSVFFMNYQFAISILKMYS
jgi:hypothetical protein